MARKPKPETCEVGGCPNLAVKPFEERRCAQHSLQAIHMSPLETAVVKTVAQGGDPVTYLSSALGTKATKATETLERMVKTSPVFCAQIAAAMDRAGLTQEAIFGSLADAALNAHTLKALPDADGNYATVKVPDYRGRNQALHMCMLLLGLYAPKQKEVRQSIEHFKVVAMPVGQTVLPADTPVVTVSKKTEDA